MNIKFCSEEPKTLSLKDVQFGQTFQFTAFEQNPYVYLRTEHGYVSLNSGRYWAMGDGANPHAGIKIVKCELHVK